MWVLVLILSLKLQMPTWYWILFTIYSTAIMPIWATVKYSALTELYKKHK